MNNHDIKLLVLDIDGTLTNSEKEITENTKKGIIHIMERGHKVILASGRPDYAMRRYAKELELEKYGGYLLSFNGARVVNCRTGEIVYQRVLPENVLPSLYKYAKEHDIGLITYLGDKIILGTRRDKYIEWESHINGMEIKEVSNFVDFIDFDVNKCLMTAEPEKAEMHMEKLKEKYKSELSIYRSEPFFIEIMPKNVDKADSLDKILSTVGMTRENTICCGDGFNDMSMIEYAGIGVAMQNAQPPVKKVADYVTKSNDEDGIVTVIDKYIL